MRNILLTAAALIFALAVLGTSVARTTAQTGPKFKIVPLSTVSTPTSSISPTPAPVDYYLAYPGILPDNFLYSLKMLRDKILLILTTDPLKKAELLLLYADKRLGAGKALVEGGKIELGLSTITKGEKYLEQAAAQSQVAQKAGKDIGVFSQRLTKAALKHQEVLEDLKPRVPDQARPLLDDLLKYPRQVLEVLKTL